MTGYIYTWNEREFMRRNKIAGITGLVWVGDHSKAIVRLDDGGKFTLSASFIACHTGFRFDTADVTTRNL